MKARLKRTWPLLAIFILLVSTVTCRPSADEATPTPTPTPTPGGEPPGVVASPTLAIGAPGSTGSSTPEGSPVPYQETPGPTATPSPCEGLTGKIEVRILVGPAAAVGLETHAVGSVPFAVSSGGPPYGVEGGGQISYHQTLVDGEINYDVTFDADVVLDGTCEDDPGNMTLTLDFDMAWDQVVEVTAPDFHGVYPNTGDNAAIVTFPLIDGATADIGGEGAQLVLQLNAQ